MDSVSQFVLGAAIGEATVGKKIGRSSMLLGGVLGTLPDLDVLVHYTDAVASFTYHRSWSHSLFVLALLSVFAAWALHRYFPKSWCRPGQSLKQSVVEPRYRDWLLCTSIILITHPLLDGFTVYGTQLLWPLPFDPIAWGSLFIIDPLYTGPLIVGLWIAWRSRSSARRAALGGLCISTAYVALSLAVQHHARQQALASLEKQGISTEHVLVAPAPLSVLWRIVAMDHHQYYEGFYSVFDKQDVLFNRYESGRTLIDTNAWRWPVTRLDWFTDGFISASVQGENLVINDLRMGIESSYVFRFDVGKLSLSEKDDAPISELLPLELNRPRIKAVVIRAIDENHLIPPTMR